MKIALISGSLRRDSYNTSLLRTLESMLPEGVEALWIDIDLPLYNFDIDTPELLPEKAAKLREQLREADGVVVCTPEYNYAIPGTVKNTIDWASRPPGEGVWGGKRVAVIGASPGFTGTARGQHMTKTCFLMAGACLYTQSEVLVGSAHTRMNEQHQLTDEATLEVLKKFTAKFLDFVRN